MRLSKLLFAGALIAAPFPPSGASAEPAVTSSAVAWAVPPQVTLNKQEINFSSHGVWLSGTLYYPAGRTNLSAVVVFHAAAEPSQDAPLYDHLKQMLPPLGVAVFVFDRRGTGKSRGGDKGKQDFDVLSDDGVAAFRKVSQDPRVNPRRVGFWGLSQGGWLALLAASKERRAAFVVSVSAPMVTADIQMNFASANILRVKGYPQSVIDRAIAARRTVDAYVRGKIARGAAERAVHAVENEPWYKLIYLNGNIDDPDWKQQISSDPLGSLRPSRTPTLLIFGQDDMWVPVQDTLKLLARSGRQGATVRVISGATHEMMLGTDPSEEMDPKLFVNFAPNAPEYLGLLASWLTQHQTAEATLGKMD